MASFSEKVAKSFDMPKFNPYSAIFLFPSSLVSFVTKKIIILPNEIHKNI